MTILVSAALIPFFGVVWSIFSHLMASSIVGDGTSPSRAKYSFTVRYPDICHSDVHRSAVSILCSLHDRPSAHSHSCLAVSAPGTKFLRIVSGVDWDWRELNKNKNKNNLVAFLSEIGLWWWSYWGHIAPSLPEQKQDYKYIRRICLFNAGMAAGSLSTWSGYQKKTVQLPVWRHFCDQFNIDFITI